MKSISFHAKKSRKAYIWRNNRHEKQKTINRQHWKIRLIVFKWSFFSFHILKRYLEYIEAYLTVQMLKGVILISYIVWHIFGCSHQYKFICSMPSYSMTHTSYLIQSAFWIFQNGPVCPMGVYKFSLIVCFFLFLRPNLSPMRPDWFESFDPLSTWSMWPENCDNNSWSFLRREPWSDIWSVYLVNTVFV